MSKEDEVRRALQPMIDAGVIQNLIERRLKDAGTRKVNLTLYGTDDSQGED